MNQKKEIQAISVDVADPYKLVVQVILFVGVCAILAVAGYLVAQYARQQEWIWAGWVCCVAGSLGGAAVVVDMLAFAIYGHVKHRIARRSVRGIYVAN